MNNTAEQTSRPAFNANGLPPAIAASAAAKAARSFCWVKDGVASYFASKERADGFCAAHGGVVFPPEA